MDEREDRIMLPPVRTLLRGALARFPLRWPVLMASALVLLVWSNPLLTTHARPSDPAPGELRIATWNMCGVQQWNCQNTGSGAQKIRALKRLATADGARVFLLQEVCAGDLATARRELGNGWRSTFRPYTFRDAEGLRTEVRCGEHRQGPAGLAILALSSLAGASALPTQQPAVGLHRGILCATVATHRVRVCNAHLSLPGSDRAHPNWEFRDDQLKSLVVAATERTVFGGDLNIAPPSAANENRRIWPAEAYLRYRECDQASASSRGGRATLLSGHKVDYLFTALPRTHCSVRATEASDHLALIMQIATV
ncbi:endonuclease/exonuclease/phosphatase family protein [Streptomyces atratus]|uniref:endonuclease/exonuclease/phosphatase family protein n=1 Tax=Streptomyces atratus TaxID=1893 RepID=UPI0033D08B09